MTDIEKLAKLEKTVTALREMKNVQCSDGNWNYDPYMLGLANGIIFSLAMFDNTEPDYLTAPKVWLCDVPFVLDNTLPDCVGSNDA